MLAGSLLYSQEEETSRDIYFMASDKYTVGLGKVLSIWNLGVLRHWAATGQGGASIFSTTHALSAPYVKGACTYDVCTGGEGGSAQRKGCCVDLVPARGMGS